MVNKILHAYLAGVGAFMVGVAFCELKLLTFGVYMFPQNAWAAVAFVGSIWFTGRMMKHAGHAR